MYKSLPVYRAGDKYCFSPFFGVTYIVSGYEHEQDRNSLQVECEYQSCILDPFLLRKREKCRTPRVQLLSKVYAHVLVFLWKYCYPLVYLLSYCRFSIYKDAGEANVAFRSILKDADQKVLCLPRSVFIATTSAKFKLSGAMFIGCAFPMRHMHAWVIEEGMHADVFDQQWIMFTPIVMMK